MGDQFLSSAGIERTRALPVAVPNPSPILDKMCTPMAPDILSSTGAGFWRNRSGPFQTPMTHWINIFLRQQETPVCSQNICSQFSCPLTPPPLPNQQSDGFALEFLLEGPQTELRTLSQNCEQNL